MSALPVDGVPPMTLALNLELSHGRHGASARIELHDTCGARRAVLTLRGWLDHAAVVRLERALAGLEERGVEQLLLDCTLLHHIDYRLVSRLVSALDRFENRSGGIVVCGMSHYLRDLFRLAGCDARLRSWPSAADLLAPPALPGPTRASAS